MSKYMYPLLDDLNFNQQIAMKKEFNDTQYDDYDLRDVEQEMERLCNMKMELAPHQIFVRNFLSKETPYKSILLYHGLGTGKTCSAITICEEYRNLLKGVTNANRILVIASKNVQDNFKIQLFDERKLEKVHGLWNITGCVSQTLVNEINPTFMKDIPKKRIIQQINILIDKHYQFMGYRQFANYVTKRLQVYNNMESVEKKKKLIFRDLKDMFSNRLLIIDEVQNIRSDSGKEYVVQKKDSDEKVYKVLLNIVKCARNLKMVLMTATPMYDTHEEIIGLINLLNANDKRSLLKKTEVFDANGNFKEGGKEKFAQKITGYVSVVRGENPYLFPYRLYPSIFNENKSIYQFTYPEKDLKGSIIPPEEYIQHLDLYITDMGEYQKEIYDKYKSLMQKSDKKQIGYTDIEPGVQLLTMTYPSLDKDPSIVKCYGSKGLDSVMTYTNTILEKKTKNEKKDFAYKPEIEKQFGRIFSLQEIGKYSKKLYELGVSIKESKGIIMIYSRYIDGGVIPIALMLEEMGMIRYGNTAPLFKERPVEGLDALTMKPKSEVGDAYHQATYTMITGDIALSHENIQETKALTDEANKNGKNVKVVIVTMAGSEGIDLKCIRQTHIIDSWYNIFRIEQLIGRSVRTCSHKLLPFRERNVQIYLYATIIPGEEETSDLNLYRRSHKKMMQIGKVSRVIKEHAIDCQLNHNQTNFTEDKLNQVIQLELSSHPYLNISYQVGDKQFSHVCDYMSSCDYTCKPNHNVTSVTESVSMPFLVLNVDKIMNRIKMLFYEYDSVTKNQLLKLIQVEKKYPEDQIDVALEKLLTDKTEYLTNRFGIQGRLVNIDQYYRFQPLELLDTHTSHYSISHPLDYKPESQVFEIKDEVILKKESKDIHKIISEIEHIYEILKDTSKKTKSSSWYTHTSKAIPYMIEELKNIHNEKQIQLTLHHLVLEHYIETDLFMDDHISLLNYLQQTKESLSPYLQVLNQYYKKQHFTFEDDTYIILLDDESNLNKGNTSSVVVYKLTNNKWERVEDITGDIVTARLQEIDIKENDYNFTIGYMYLDKSKQEKRLKLLNQALKGKKVKGFWCNQKGPTDIELFLKPLLSKFRINGQEKATGVVRCIEMEMYLRYFDKMEMEDEDGMVKRYFIDPVSIIIIENKQS